MKNVSAAVAIRQNKILITRRAPGEKLAGFWEFPGGKQEDDESIQACLVRELEEELGVVAFCGDVLVECRYTYEGGAINLIAIETKIIEGEISLSVHDQYQWVSPDDLLKFQLAPADIPIAEWIINRYVS
jgi:8-oxo-dGTP diphosphatase